MRVDVKAIARAMAEERGWSWITMDQHTQGEWVKQTNVALLELARQMSGFARFDTGAVWTSGVTCAELREAANPKQDLREAAEQLVQATRHALDCTHGPDIEAALEAVEAALLDS